jgi:ketosteroid isomerase-like protein
MTTTRSAAEIARASYEAFVRRDRQTMESLLSDDFTFTSPYDDHIDRATYFARCWPYGETIQYFRVLSLMESDGEVMIAYEITPRGSNAFRNSERLRVQDGKVTEVEVFFGALPEPASAQTYNGNDLAAIHTLIEERGNALRARNVGDLYSQVAAENVSFDVVDPLQYVGAEQTRKRAEEWLGTFDGTIGYEVRDLQVAAAGNVGFAHCLTRLSGTTANGALNMWVRSTMCFRKFDGEWQVVHEHNSVPFDAQTGKASLSLEP